MSFLDESRVTLESGVPGDKGKRSGSFISGGSRRARDARPLAQNVFIFMQFPGKIGQIIG